MVKGFSDNEVKNNTQNIQIKEKKGLAGFLEGKKFTYTLPGKKQINIFGSIVIGLNIILVLLVILYLKNQEFHDFVFNVGR
uniref:Putative Beta-lactamase n=1 Tax=uncultured Prochlorococcus marinus clone HF10-88H9 TaxID=379381 RepID=Q1PJS5_PROMR|nr:putative Beta-lactamase [uncultured Prochlorococcus marinus clone HF10-88H9]